MFRLAHISDVHLGPLPDVRMRELISKRITGYANWKFNRHKSHGGNAVDLIVDDIHAANVDHIAVTGDLVNLALDAEIRVATEWLHEVGVPDHVSVVPGNHDAYVRGALAKACHAWSGYIPHPPAGQFPQDVDEWFPYVRRLGPVALIGCSSAIASAPFLSIGLFEKAQGKRLVSILEQTAKEGLFRVIMIHHPPFRYEDDTPKRLYGIRRFQKLLREHGAELVLHGHTHIESYREIGGKDAGIPVIGVPSSAQNIGGTKPPARWNEFAISGEAGNWNCLWRERGLQPDNTVGQVRERTLWQNGKLNTGIVPVS